MQIKSDIDKLDIDKLKNVPSNLSNWKKIYKNQILENTPVDLIKLSNIVINYVFVKTEFNELVKKINNIGTAHTNDLVKK